MRDPTVQPLDPMASAPLSAIPLEGAAPALAGVTEHRPDAHAAPAPPHGLAAAIVAAGEALGLARVGFCGVEALDDAAAHLDRWRALERHGVMTYMATGSRSSPGALLPGARTAIVVAVPYAGRDAEIGGGQAGAGAPIARYARGRDYHEVLKPRLRALADRCAELLGRTVRARACVDTAPLLERELARRAGVGFLAKSTLSIVPGLGSYVVLGVLLVDFEVPPSAPAIDACGTCTKCLDACPTGAFTGPFELDARRCIAYLTIEQPGTLPHELRRSIGTRVFGCDVCQEICPHNASPKPRDTLASLRPRAAIESLDVSALLALGNSDHKRLKKQSAIGRISRPQLARNAAVALGNSGDSRHVGPLVRALESHSHVVVRAHAAWALGELGGPSASTALEHAAASDASDQVRVEAARALETISASPR